MKANNTAELVGDTPLVKIDGSTHGLDGVRLWAKMELLNPYGSVKDRIGKTMYWDQRHGIDADTVIESSSGNTAKALTALTEDKHGFKTVTNRIKLDTVRDILTVLGADIDEVPGSNECPDPTNPDNPNEIIRDMVRANPETYYHTNQYFTDDNPSAHEGTGEEILRELPGVDVIVGDLGTAGTTKGIGRHIRQEQDNPASIHGVFTDAAGYVPGGRNRNELFETGLFDKDFYDEIHEASTQDAIDGMLDLIRKEGILCGPTTGLVYAAITDYLSDQETDGVDVVFIACDRMEPYIGYLKDNRPSLFTASKQEESLPEPAYITYGDIKPSMVQVDTRVQFAYQRNPYPNSINIPLKTLESLLEQGPPFSQDETVVLLCPEGVKTRFATQKLRSYDVEAYSVENGMNPYREEWDD